MNNAKKIILTGGTGLIGYETIKPLLESNFEVFVLTRQNIKNDIVGLQYLKIDLFDSIQLKNIFNEIKPEYLLNLAWKTDSDYINSIDNYKYVSSGLNLLENFKNNGGKRAVFVGTCFEYKFKDDLIKEEDELDFNKNTYTFCKNQLNTLAKRFCAEYNISYAWARIFYAYGKNENKDRFLYNLINKLKNNEKVIIENADVKRDYIYSKDIANALIELLKSDIKGDINISNALTYSKKEFSLNVAKKLKKEGLLIFKENKSSQVPIIIGDNKKLINKVKFKPKYDLSTALDEILSEESCV